MHSKHLAHLDDLMVDDRRSQTAEFAIGSIYHMFTWVMVMVGLWMFRDICAFRMQHFLRRRGNFVDIIFG